jgi:hypothetical protein
MALNYTFNHDAENKDKHLDPEILLVLLKIFWHNCSKEKNRVSITKASLLMLPREIWNKNNKESPFILRITRYA